MKRLTLLTVALLCCSGCASVNDSIVRMYFQDHALGDRVNSQIRKGLEKRKAAPDQVVPKQPAPAYLDEG